MVLQVEVYGIIPVNSYFYVDDETNHGFLIDPGAESTRLLRIIDEKNFVIEKILLTHGHFDHIGAVRELQDKLNVEVCMQKNGAAYVENPAWNLSRYFDTDFVLTGVKYLDDYSEIILNANPNFKLKIIPVAGHTTDGAIFYSAKDKLAFVGDSIFLNSFGRTDFPGGDKQALFENIEKNILTLPEDTVLLSGHSDSTTVKNEKTRSWFNV